MLSETAVLIPALNEEEALPILLAALPITQLHSVLVVDNGSTDRTPVVASEAGATVLKENERGYGAACLKGLASLGAAKPPPRFVVFLDADHPEDVPHIATLVAALEEGADLVMGIRTSEAGGEGNTHTHARLGNRLVLSLAHVLFGHRFRDMGPFRAMTLQGLGDLQMDDRNWGWTLQMQVRAVRARMTVREIPVPHQRRSVGESKISGSFVMSVKVGAKMFLTLLRERFRS